MVAPVSVKQPWPIWEDESYKPAKNDDLTTTKQITTKPWVFFMGYTVYIEAILASYMLTAPRQMGRGSDKNIRHSWNNLRYLLLCSYIKAYKFNFPRIQKDCRMQPYIIFMETKPKSVHSVKITEKTNLWLRCLPYEIIHGSMFIRYKKIKSSWIFHVRILGCNRFYGVEREGAFK